MIAAIFADAHYKISGSSAFSFSVLAGNKADGTDMHTITAKTIGIGRDVAKNINYAL
jgi:DNA polymerase gamma 1